MLILMCLYIMTSSVIAEHKLFCNYKKTTGAVYNLTEVWEFIAAFLVFREFMED